MEDDQSSQSDMNIPEQLSGEFDNEAVPMQLVGSPPVPSFMSNIGNSSFIAGSQDSNASFSFTIQQSSASVLGMSSSTSNLQIHQLNDSGDNSSHIWMGASGPSFLTLGTQSASGHFLGLNEQEHSSRQGRGSDVPSLILNNASISPSNFNIGADVQLRELVEETISGRSALMHEGLIRGAESRISSNAVAFNSNGKCPMIPRTEEEWNKIVEKICNKVSSRPLSLSILEEIQQSMHILIDGRKALKLRRSMALRKGDIVLVCNEGDDSIAPRRGIIESENSDGTYTIKFHSSPNETMRVEASQVRALHRWTSASSSSNFRANQYLLQRAIPARDPNLVNEFLKEGADPNVTDESGNPAILVAINKKCPVEIVGALLRAGADPDVSPDKLSPLQAAVNMQDADYVSCLLEHGCDATSVDLSNLDVDGGKISKMILEYQSTSLSSERRALLQNQAIAKILPLVISVGSSQNDVTVLLTIVGFLSYMLDKLSTSLLCNVLPAINDSEVSHLAFRNTENLYEIMLQQIRGDGCDSLDAIFCLLRIIFCLIDKVPNHYQLLRKVGLIRWVERLSNASQTKQDVQAGLLISKSGKIKEKHITKLAQDILSKAPPFPQESSLCANLRNACQEIRSGQPEGFRNLSATLMSSKYSCPQEIVSSALPSVLLQALDGDGEMHKEQWRNFNSAFAPFEEVIQSDSSVTSNANVGNTGLKIDYLIRPLIDLISSEEVWPLTAMGSDDLQDLTRPVKLDLFPRSMPGSECDAQPKPVLGVPSLSLHVEPLLRIEELQRHFLRICTPPTKYIAFCHYILGSKIEERPAGASGSSFRRAQVVGFQMLPSESIREKMTSDTDAADVKMDENVEIALDPTTQASCLSVSEDGNNLVVTCISKGSPAGTVQANRAFSRSIDGPIAYFEVMIRKRGPSGAIGVGLARAGYSNNKMPGWEPVSHAWHGDDGCTFNSCGTGTPLSSPWSEGDVIGCGIDFNRSSLFFTRNGVLQGQPIRIVDTSGLHTTVGFQTKGECVSISFKPPFFYDLSTHDISPPRIPIHTIKYLDGAQEERFVNLLGREFFIRDMPSHGDWGDGIRKKFSYFCAHGIASPEVKSFLAWIKAQLSMNGRMLSASVLSESEVKRLVKHGWGRELLCELDFKFNEDGTVSGSDLDSRKVQALLEILEDFSIGKSDEAMAVETKADTEPTRNQTVLIVIPEGFPPELFFEEVEEHLRHALSQADPLVAPASGHLGDPYKWPDRGFDHEEAWYESLMTALAEVQTGAIARGQTQYEAETLVSRLSSVVQCRIVTDDSQDYTLRAREVKRSQGGAGSGLTIGDRVQVSTGEKEWVTGTLLMVEDANRFGVICDDGSWLSMIPQDHIKGLKNAGRGVGNRRALAPDIHELMVSHVRDARMLEQLAVFTGAQTRPTADLRRKFSCFEVGDINRDGYTAPKRRLEMWNSSQVPMTEDFGQSKTIVLPPKPLKVEFDVPQQGGEMIKVKSASQLSAALEKSKSSFVGILVVDAQARPPSGQSWPPPIKSASSLIKSLAQRFGNGKFLRILSGTTPECLDQLGIPRGSFQPYFMLYASGQEEARWQQNKQFELIWEPCHENKAVSHSPSAAAFLKRTIHRNEFASFIERAIDTWHYDEKLRSPSSSAIESFKTVHQSLQGTNTGDVAPASYILHYSMRFLEGDIDDWCSDMFEVQDGARKGRAQHAMSLEDCESTRDVWNSNCVKLNDPVKQALEVVKLLYRRVGKFSGNQKSWQSVWLTKRLSCQLQDALSFCSCSLPAWCMSIPRVVPFLFSLDARQRLLDCCGFGSSHAVYRFQEWKVAAYRSKHADSMRSAQQQLARAREQQDIDGISRATDDLDDIERRMYNKRIGAIASDLARVSRGNILENAMRLFDVHHASKHLLEVQFHEEDGFGSGVTQNFYEAVSVALQVRKLNHQNKLWISDGHDAEYAMEPDGPFKYLTNPDGLFPQPLPENASPDLVSSLEKQFRFMGRLFAKACRDKFTVPLPLHPHFFRTLQNVFNESPLELLATFNKGREALLPSDDWSSLHLVDAYCAIVSDLKAQCANVNSEQLDAVYKQVKDREFMATYLNRSYECSLSQFWESSEAKFVDPLTNSPLCTNGESIQLSVQNLERYVELVADMWFNKGICRQISAFKQGINDVFPFSALQIFSAAEIELMLCGERVIEWDKASLEQHFKLVSNEQGSRYTKESPPVQMLLEELVSMSNADRARFLDFVTACPRLPPGGLASLSIEIAPETRSRYPRSRTCSKLMWLPAYSSLAELREHMRAALINAKEGGFHEHNEALVLTNVRPPPAGESR